MGFAHGFSITRQSRENQRATQILAEKMETIRLYTWDQLNTPGYVPTNFTSYAYPEGILEASRGITYTGLLSISKAPLTEGYASDLKDATVTVKWTTGSIQHTRKMTTLISRYGLQNYIYTAK
jgi:hypothetical protein